MSVCFQKAISCLPRSPSCPLAPCQGLAMPLEAASLQAGGELEPRGSPSSLEGTPRRALLSGLPALATGAPGLSLVCGRGSLSLNLVVSACGQKAFVLAGFGDRSPPPWRDREKSREIRLIVTCPNPTASPNPQFPQERCKQTCTHPPPPAVWGLPRTSGENGTRAARFLQRPACPAGCSWSPGIPLTPKPGVLGGHPGSSHPLDLGPCLKL